MDLFVHYDIERLRRYATLPTNASRIHLVSSTAAQLLCFPEVDYFNYSVCYEPRQLSQLIQEAGAFYQQHGVTCHRLLVEETPEAAEAHALLQQKHYTWKGNQVLMHQNSLSKTVARPSSQTWLRPVCTESLLAFTKDYLSGFDSQRTDISQVASNFRQLLSSPSISLYRVIADEQAVGVAVLYRHGSEFLLAGGAVLSQYRQKGYHKKALISRLQQCYQQNATAITGWAYDQSISYQNMLKLGLTPHKRYRIYESHL